MEQMLREYLNAQPGEAAVWVQDLTDGTTAIINADAVFPSASTIKLVIMACLLEKVRDGQMSLDDLVTMTPDMKTGGDGILKELRSGHQFALEELLTLMIIVSDNTATNILIDRLGMEEINATANALGMKQTVLGRRMMDSQAKKLGKDNFTCARDLALVLEKIYREQCVDASMSRLMMDLLKRQQQTGRLQLYLPEDVEIAHKCGDLDYLEHDVGIVFLPKHPYLIVVLTKDNPTNKEGRELIGIVSKIVWEQMLKKTCIS